MGTRMVVVSFEGFIPDSLRKAILHKVSRTRYSEQGAPPAATELAPAPAPAAAVTALFPTC